MGALRPPKSLWATSFFKAFWEDSTRLRSPRALSPIAGFLTDNEDVGGPCGLHSQPRRRPTVPTCWDRPRACCSEGPVLALELLLPHTAGRLDSPDGTQICKAGEGLGLGKGFPWDRRSHDLGLQVYHHWDNSASGKHSSTAGFAALVLLLTSRMTLNKSLGLSFLMCNLWALIASPS